MIDGWGVRILWGGGVEIPSPLLLSAAVGGGGGGSVPQLRGAIFVEADFGGVGGAGIASEPSNATQRRRWDVHGTFLPSALLAPSYEASRLPAKGI